MLLADFGMTSGFDGRPIEVAPSTEGELIVELDSDNAYLYHNGGFVKTPIESSRRNDENILDNILLYKYPGLSINESMRDSNGNIWYAFQLDRSILWALALALVFMFLCWPVGWWLDKKKIYIKV